MFTTAGSGRSPCRTIKYVVFWDAGRPQFCARPPQRGRGPTTTYRRDRVENERPWGLLRR
ncbi:hypothetical protein CSUI_002105 [Cystoisospora suis]|uniref:Uncharacterized protein n=1 Tax=Cystoisospora suis TaxID=483139 RepID=A0A2C6LAH8_9APIC|nr:hypothetical protein CSUI_002105 [Cystoisospora suis]